MEKIKVVIDTNVFISSLIGKTRTNPKEIIDGFKKNKFSLILSPAILKEIEETLKEPKLKSIFNEDEAFNLLGLIRIRGLFVIPARKVNTCRDTHDNKILEAALKAKADFIITGDKDLLILKSFRSIPILTPKEFLTKILRG